MFDTPISQREILLTPAVLKANLEAGHYNDARSEKTRLRKRAAINKAQKDCARAGAFMLEEEFPSTREEVVT